MTTARLDEAPAHPLERLVELFEAGLAEGAGAPAWTLSPAQLEDLLPRLGVVINQVDGVALGMLCEADRHQVGDRVGAANTAAWWANTARVTKPVAHQLVALAADLDDPVHEVTAAALSAGAVSVEQAAVILRAVEALPGELVSVALRRDAEARLVGLAADHDVKDLRVLGRKILEVIAPEVAEAHEQKVWEDEERHAVATASFSMRPDGLGSMVGRFKIPSLAGEMLGKHLAAIAAPKHQAALEAGSSSLSRRGEEHASVSRPLRLGQAFVEYVETRSADDTPHAGGIAATVVVTMTEADLRGASNKPALLDTGASISASEARRLACEAGIIPAVLGSRSQPLDLGRKTRFHTAPQRHALALRDRGCAADGCDWPPGMCHAHHGIPWSKGGDTNVKDGILLCPRHHTIAHDSRFQMKTTANGKVLFSRRT